MTNEDETNNPEIDIFSALITLETLAQVFALVPEREYTGADLAVMMRGILDDWQMNGVPEGDR